MSATLIRDTKEGGDFHKMAERIAASGLVTKRDGSIPTPKEVWVMSDSLLDFFELYNDVVDVEAQIANQ